jgi:hypothetical protein
MTREGISPVRAAVVAAATIVIVTASTALAASLNGPSISPCVFPYCGRTATGATWGS